MKKTLLVLAAVFVMSVFVYAQTGVAGKWAGEQQGRNGATPIALELKVAGATATGTMTTGTADPVAITDGKVDGMKVTFTVAGGRGPVMYSGEVTGGDTLTLTRAAGAGGGGGGGGRGPMPLVLKRK